MDYADDDAVKRFELFMYALEKLAHDGHQDAQRMVVINSITRLKCKALVNAAMQEGDTLSSKIAKSFPRIDVVKLVDDMRVKAMELRLGGEA